jgi:hypothetical protein
LLDSGAGGVLVFRALVVQPVIGPDPLEVKITQIGTEPLKLFMAGE